MLRKYSVKAWACLCQCSYYGSQHIASNPKEAIEIAKARNITLMNWGYEAKSLGKV